MPPVVGRCRGIDFRNTSWGSPSAARVKLVGAGGPPSLDRRGARWLSRGAAARNVPTTYASSRKGKKRQSGVYVTSSEKLPALDGLVSQHDRRAGMTEV